MDGDFFDLGELRFGSDSFDLAVAGGRSKRVARRVAQRCAAPDCLGQFFTEGVQPPVRGELSVLKAASLDAFFKAGFASGGENLLIRKSEMDLWSVAKQGESFVISRLFDETGSPLVVAKSKRARVGAHI
jgi:hypothetical protein